MEWISVEDSLPEKGGRYLVYEKKPPHAHNCAVFNYPYPCCEPNIAYFHAYSNLWAWSSFSSDPCDPSHWMPIPEPPHE